MPPSTTIGCIFIGAGIICLAAGLGLLDHASVKIARAVREAMGRWK